MSTPEVDPKYARFIVQDVPFVAYLSGANLLKVTQKEGELTCRQNRVSLIVIQIALLFFGWLLTCIVLQPWMRPVSPRTPWPILAAVAAFALFVWFSFFRNLMGRPHFRADAMTGEIELFRYRTRKPWKRIPAPEISHFTITKQFFMGTGQQMQRIENAVLTIFFSENQKIALCASPDEGLIQSLGEQLARITGRRLEN